MAEAGPTAGAGRAADVAAGAVLGAPATEGAALRDGVVASGAWLAAALPATELAEALPTDAEPTEAGLVVQTAEAPWLHLHLW